MQYVINHVITNLNWFIHTNWMNQVVGFYNIIGGCIAILSFFWITIPTEKVQRWWGVLLLVIYIPGFLYLWYGLSQVGRSPFFWFDGAIFGFLIGIAWLRLK